MPETPAAGGDFSQDDIDKLFDEMTKGPGKPAESASKPAAPKPAPAAAKPAAPSPADDIDAILASAGAGGSAGGGTVSQDELDALLGKVTEGDSAGGADIAGLPLEKFEFQHAGGGPAAPSPKTIELLRDVLLDVKIELGRANMYVRDVLNLSKGSVVELDKLAGDPLDILINNRLVAKGEVLVLNDNFCVRITDILSPRERQDQERQ